MANGITASVQAGDVSRLVRAMDKLQSELGMLPGEAIKAGAFAVARALGAASKIAPKKRKVVARPNEDKRKAQFAAIKPSKSGDIDIPIKADTIAEAREDKRAQITKSGLAKAVWGHVGKGVKGGSIGGKDVKGASGSAKVVKNLQKHDASIAMTNKLGYASEAFKSKGRATLDNAMSRAANGMIKYLERKTKKTAQQLGF